MFIMIFMTAITFDTLKFSRRLEASGFTPQQATGAAEALAETMQAELVTHGILRSEVQSLEVRLLKWLIPLLLGQTALTVTLTVTLVKLLS